MQNNKLFVGGLSWDTTEEGLREAFAPFGNIINVVIIKHRDTGRSKGFGFVEFENDDDAAKAMEALDGSMLDGRAIAASIAKPKAPREDNFRRGSGSFGNNRGGGGYGNDRRNNDDQF